MNEEHDFYLFYLDQWPMPPSRVRVLYKQTFTEAITAPNINFLIRNQK